MENKHALLAALAVTGSLGLHGAAYAALGFAPAPGHSAIPRRTVELEIAARPKPAAPVEEPPKAAVEEPPPGPMPAPTPKAKAPPKPAENPAPPAPAPTEAVPPGVTLTDPDGLANETTITGVGGAIDGPVGPVAASPPPVAAPSLAPPAPPRPAGPRLVAARDLAERPSPPSLDDALRRHYPPDARRKGLGGRAAVRARIEPDGSVRSTSVLSESDAGFGEACRRTLLGSRWSPPRDRDGRPVATEIRYTCRFVVGR